MRYFDHNATTPPADAVTAAMHDALRDCWANPSSTHRAGQRVRQNIELARKQVAQLLGCEDREVIFTSGGTEAANLAIRGTFESSHHRVFVTSRLEHPAVRDMAGRLEALDIETVWLRNDRTGLVDLDQLNDVLRSRGEEIGLVSIMWANNETGVIQPIDQIGTLCHEYRVLFHTDATQWVGKHATNVADLPIDLLSFAAHKFHGPKGIGGLYRRRGVRLTSQMIGGSQERQQRGGTENVPGIIGLGKAAELARTWINDGGPAKLAALRDDFEQWILQADAEAQVNPASLPATGRLCNTANIGFTGLEAEAILLMLSERGVFASGGAACASGSLEPSPVLQAMQLPGDVVNGSLRFSLSRFTSVDDVNDTVAIIADVIQRLRGSVSAPATARGPA